jgi:class 3 adenylate cyclase/tetratricopeptide (TPR) repeat protein
VAASGPASPAGTEQRRLVSIVFCDLVGSTALSGRLDPEVLRTVTLRYFALMRGCVEAHGGVVEKFIGDAVMAAFGVPVLHEDDPRRALAAAQGMRSAVTELNRELAAGLGIQLAVRIGVNTGEVVTDPDISAGHGFVSGEAVNVAARLEQNAHPGQILVGPQTVLAAGPAVIVEPAGLITLRGKAEPVTAYALLDVRSDEPELLRRFDLPFVGRTSERAELTLVLERVHRQAGCQLMTVYGDAGIGKTRLVRAWLAASGVRSGTGRCRPYGEAGTLAPLAEAIAALTAALPAQALPRVLRDGLLRDGTPNASAAETVATISELLAGLAPVVLVLDDCHWADPALLDVVEDIIDHTEHDRVLFLCLSRPELVDQRRSWGSGRMNASSLVLQPLSADEADLLAAGLVEVGAHSDGALAGLVHRAEGNPLHLEQLAAALLQDGGSHPLPASVQGLLAARIDALAPVLRAVLDLAAVVGRDVDVEVMRRLVGPGGDDPGPVLRELSHRRLVEPVRTAGTGPGFRFRSALIHEVAYLGMAKRVRAERHERLAAVLTGPGPEQVAARAGHLEAAYRFRRELGTGAADLADLRRRAITALTRAGRTALGRADLTWAADLLGRAVRLAEPGEPGWADAGRLLGEALLALGRTDEGSTLLHTVLAHPDTDAVTVAHTRLLLSAHAPDTGPGSPAEVARITLPVFVAADDRLGIARATVRLAHDQQFHGRHQQALQLLEDSLRSATGIGADAEQAVALGAIGVSLWLGPTPAGPAIERCRVLLAEHDGPVAQATVSCPLAVLLAMQGQAEAARDHLATAERLSRDLGYAEAEAFLPVFGSHLELLAGDAEAAEELLLQALRAARHLGYPSLLQTAARDLTRLLIGRGDGAGAGDVLGPVPELLPPAEAADDAGLRARISAHTEGPEVALSWVRQALAAADRTDSPLSQGFAEFDQAQTLLALGRAPEAAAAADRAAGWFVRKGHLVAARWCAELKATADPGAHR